MHRAIPRNTTGENNIKICSSLEATQKKKMHLYIRKWSTMQKQSGFVVHSFINNLRENCKHYEVLD